MKASVELENFTELEAGGLADGLLVRLQAVRYLVGSPIHITSGVRLGDNGAHARGLGADISDNRIGKEITSGWRHKVLRAAYAVGFSRVGDYPKHIHLDISKSLDQDVTWWADDRSD